ncbi:hypothetical protein [Flavobacterium sp. IMCC34518]|uniref:hypothetical protein n=1 Tax=Flavobacterium sp. IMCC34518 TaxID=3003623 RepID=UPI0022ABEF7C|nr:hypothetical protein [Flavobacterium sp. IMCC34518]
MSTISSKDVFRPDRIWPFRFAYQLLYFKDTFHIFNIVKDMSPDGSKYPFMPVFGIKDIAYSGSEVDEKTNTSAPKNKKTAKRCHFEVLNICSCTSRKKARGSN